MFKKIKNFFLEKIDMFLDKPSIFFLYMVELGFTFAMGIIIIIAELVLVSQFLSETIINKLKIDVLSFYVFALLMLIIPFVCIEALTQVHTARRIKEEEYLSEL